MMSEMVQAIITIALIIIAITIMVVAIVLVMILSVYQRGNPNNRLRIMKIIGMITGNKKQ